jgi:hypothetical protein
MQASRRRPTVPEQEIAIPGKYSDIEETILIYMYEHPWELGTSSLVLALRPGLQGEEQRKAWEEIQYGIETLVENRLAKGKRLLLNNLIQFSSLVLTPKGEAEAITVKRRLKTVVLIHDVPRPNRSGS